ncbi:MAG: hypothetical protein IJJ52_02080 [Lachnospiraceae bacterium]|nr:hypothetical protein [Lachnospiraceae bacterium]
MTRSRVLIKFIDRPRAANVISTMAVEPEILIPVGYDEVLNDRMRSRYNYFFHRKGIPTICAEPVRLERYLEADMEIRLERLLEKYQSRSPVVDISDADRLETLALGHILEKHKYWGIGVLDYRIREGIFLPLKNAGFLQRLTFPRLLYEDYTFLREEKNPIVPDFTRKDLTKQAVKEIRTLGRLYAAKPSYWKDLSARLSFTLGEISEDKLEFVIDAASLGIRDAAFEELRDVGVLSFFERKNGIVRIKAADKVALRLLTSIGDLPLMGIFLTAAGVREYGKNAAYHDLRLIRGRYVTGINRCLPVIIALCDDRVGADDVVHFAGDTVGIYDEPVRRILVRYGEKPWPDDVRSCAENYEVELVYAGDLANLLEPR